jgi:hypothetical protein
MSTLHKTKTVLFGERRAMKRDSKLVAMGTTSSHISSAIFVRFGTSNKGTQREVNPQMI